MQERTIPGGQELLTLFGSMDERFEDEKRVFCAAVRELLAVSGEVSRRAIIFCIIGEMETTRLCRINEGESVKPRVDGYSGSQQIKLFCR